MIGLYAVAITDFISPCHVKGRQFLPGMLKVLNTGSGLPNTLKLVKLSSISRILYPYE